MWHQNPFLLPPERAARLQIVASLVGRIPEFSLALAKSLGFGPQTTSRSDICHLLANLIKTCEIHHTLSWPLLWLDAEDPREAPKPRYDGTAKWKETGSLNDDGKVLHLFRNI